MKVLLENWREYAYKKPLRRVKSNILEEVTEEEIREFPLSDEELDKIKRWAGLSGDPLFLGSGTMGSAYQFGDEVLKITKDYAEASAAQSIAGQSHPNVYKIKAVARRFGQGEAPPAELSDYPFLIVYDLVGEEVGGSDIPNKNQQDVIKTMHGKPETIYYNWTENLDQIKAKFLNWVKSNPKAVEEGPVSRFQNHGPKLEALLSSAGLDARDASLLKAAWSISVGLYSAQNINSAEGIANALVSPMMNYVDDIARGLTFLKQNGIHFRDLKTTNVMNDRGRLIIIDIGKSDVKQREPIEKI